MPSHLPYIAISAFDIMALAAVIGALATGLWIIPEGARESFHRRLWRLTGLSLGALTVSSVVLLVGRTLEMSRQSMRHVGHWLPLVMRETSFGHIWMVRPIMLLVAWAAWFIGRRPARHRAAYGILLATAIIAFTRSATGHPADQGQWTAPEWVDFVHLMAASVWAGGLFAMTVAIFPFLPKARLSTPVRLALVERLSSLAALALAGILVTGVLSAYHYLGGFRPLFHSPYGHILLVKLALVAVAIALGAANRFVFVPRIRAAQPASPTLAAPTREADERAFSHLARSVAIETGFLGAALVAAAVLLHGMPPSEMAHTIGGSMAQASQPAGRFEFTRFEDSRGTPMAPAISTIRYGVLRRNAADMDDSGRPRSHFDQMSL
ncbi:hypothetical protein C4901_07420 [Acidiferrobacter sp. SPIII_3]|jgi:putative copper resistance protein D|uniref:copper resistance D family protein n=1 Tax=Acidiferrobacter sp. SPIII_3 TaxID=1281578 RepID=UPI000D72B4AC|nr:CopD family protein [Acidiferrobacter sp. SPIII_3]AWP23177.1 hypothetical protein C4901_07420 [Acidiferrobacter sp. SPIII_3]